MLSVMILLQRVMSVVPAVSRFSLVGPDFDAPQITTLAHAVLLPEAGNWSEDCCGVFLQEMGAGRGAAGSFLTALKRKRFAPSTGRPGSWKQQLDLLPNTGRADCSVDILRDGSLRLRNTMVSGETGVSWKRWDKDELLRNSGPYP